MAAPHASSLLKRTALIAVLAVTCGACTRDIVTFSMTLSGQGAAGSVIQLSTITCGDSGSLTPPCVIGAARGTEITLTALPASGAVLTNWSLPGCTAPDPCVFVLEDAVAIDASFDIVAPATNRARIQTGGPGTGNGVITSSPAGINCTVTAGVLSGTCEYDFVFDPGVSVVFIATPAAGSVFDGFGGSCPAFASSTCTLTMDTPRFVGVSFSLAPPVQLTAVLAGSGQGTVTSSPAGINCTSLLTSSVCAAPFAVGTVVSLTAQPAAGSTFTGWSGACSGTGACLLSMIGARSVTATFTSSATFTLTLQQGSAVTGNGTVTSNPAGISCTFTNGQVTPSGTCVFAFPANAAVTLTPTPAAPSTFVTFTGAPTCGFGVTNCVVTMDQNRTVGVIFNP